MTYEVKYEDYNGNVHVEKVNGFDKRDAVSHLSCPYKSIYWINECLAKKKKDLPPKP